MSKYIIPSYQDYTYNHYDKGSLEPNLYGGSSCDGYDKPPNILPRTKRIIAIGDIHGDYELLIKCLRLANVINDNLIWIGKDTVVIQVGDQIDNCRDIDNCINHKNDKPEDVKILVFMTELHKQAFGSGGGVYSLIGNHELMNIEGDMRYVSYQNILTFSKSNNFAEGYENRKKYFARGSEMAKLLACLSAEFNRKQIYQVEKKLYFYSSI